MKRFLCAIATVLVAFTTSADEIRNIPVREAHPASESVPIGSEFLVEPLDQRGEDQGRPDVAVAKGEVYVVWRESSGWRGIVPGATSSDLIDPLAGVIGALTASNDAHLLVIDGKDGWLRHDAAHREQIVIEPHSMDIVKNGVASNGTTFAMGYREGWFAGLKFALFDESGSVLHEGALPTSVGPDVYSATVARFDSGYIATWNEYPPCRITCPPMNGVMRAMRFDEHGNAIDSPAYTITPTASGDAAVAWSPNGALVVWSQWDATKGFDRLLATRLSSDGRPVDFAGGNVGVELPVANPGSGAGSYDVAWDGEHFVIVAAAAEAPWGQIVAGFWISGDPANATRFTIPLDGGGNQEPFFMPSVAGLGGGKSIVVYQRIDAQSGIMRVYARTVGTSERRRLVRR